MADPVAPTGGEVAPAAPEVTPAAPVTAAPNTDHIEADEWSEATKQAYPNYKEEKNEPTKPTTTETTTVAPTTTETTTEHAAAPQPNEPPKADDSAAPAPVASTQPPQDPALAARVQARQSAQALQTLKDDIRSELFADVPTKLLDRDGKPIETVEDVMGFINPQTDEPFTMAEAGSWLLAKQQQLNARIAETDKEVERIADVRQSLEDQASLIEYKYGEILKEKPDLKARVWASYEQTLQKRNNQIVDAPVSLENFYDIALGPYLEQAKATQEQAAAVEQQTAADAAAQAAAEKKIKDDAEAARQARRQDRSSLYGPTGAADTKTEEDDEWNAAAEQQFGKRR